MTPTALLTHEHRHIERALGALDALARRVGRGERPLDALAEALEVLTVYADRAHHGKEEAHLFPAMARAGHGPADGPVGVMLEEHTLGRRQVEALRDALTDLRGGDDRAADDFARAAADYGGMLREHIEKEDGVVFPIADDLLGGEAAQLETAYAAADAAAFGALGRAGWEARIAALAAAAAPSRAGGPAGAGAR